MEYIFISLHDSKIKDVVKILRWLWIQTTSKIKKEGLCTVIAEWENV